MGAVVEVEVVQHEEPRTSVDHVGGLINRQTCCAICH